MARKRMIDPDFWNDEKLGTCNRNERLFFMGLISNSDDEGRGRANPKLLKSTIFPYDEDIKSKDIETMLVTLYNKKLTFVYILDGQEFYYLPNFLKHQVINKPQPSKIPVMPENTEEIQLPEYYGKTTVIVPPKRIEKKIIEEEKNIIADYTSNVKLQQTIKDFIEMRNKIKKPMTDKAVNLLFNKLDELGKTDEQKIVLLEEAITHNWQSVYPLKQVSGTQKKNAFDNFQSRYDKDPNYINEVTKIVETQKQSALDDDIDIEQYLEERKAK